MITIQSLTNPDKIVEVDAVHFEDVLSKQGVWVVIPPPEPEDVIIPLREKLLTFFMRL